MPYDWHILQNNNLWQEAEGINNPCPVGYRLPTEAEWEAERQSWESSDAAGAFGSPLNLPVAGARHCSLDVLYYVGLYGSYWSSKVAGNFSRLQQFHSSYAYPLTNDRARGYSVRCVKD